MIKLGVFIQPSPPQDLKCPLRILKKKNIDSHMTHSPPPPPIYCAHHFAQPPPPPTKILDETLRKFKTSEMTLLHEQLSSMNQQDSDGYVKLLDI